MSSDLVASQAGLVPLLGQGGQTLILGAIMVVGTGLIMWLISRSEGR